MILAIDTSLGTAVAVVEDDGVVLAEGASENPLGHAEAIGGLLQDALAAASASPESSAEALTYVAAGMGPGPFTGLRVGIAAARAFALGRGIPVVPVVSHDAVALEVLLAGALTGTEPARFAVVTDARRREFAFTVYDGIDDDGLPVRSTEPALIPRDDIDARLAELGAERRDAGSGVGRDGRDRRGDAPSAAGRIPAWTEPLYLRSPDVTMPHGPKRVTAPVLSERQRATYEHRRATLADLDAIMALERASFPTDAWSDAMMREELASPHGWYVVVEEAGRLIGYAGLRAARGAADADIQTIAIAAGGRGRGRGTGAAERSARGGRAPRRARRVPRGAGRQPGRAVAVRVGGLRRGRAAGALLPARRRRRDRHAPRRGGMGGATRARIGGNRRFRGRRWRDLTSGASVSSESCAGERCGGVHMNRAEPLVLGIETSCDETGIGIVRGRTLLSNTIASSMDEHARYGGVVPEVAARAHLEALTPSIEAALAEARCRPCTTSTPSRSRADPVSPAP